MGDFLTVTELAGDDVSMEQVERLCSRYYWAASYCTDKDVLEVACGTGQGLGYLAKFARNISAGDYSAEIIKKAKDYYGNRFNISQFDAQDMPFPDNSLDIIIIFEAIYYLCSADRFITECRRVLRSGGKILIATANKDLYDFNPSPYSYKYYGVVELRELLAQHGFEAVFFGNVPVEVLSWRQKLTRPVKKIAVKFNLIPKTNNGKKLFKRLVFGQLVKMPAEVGEGMINYKKPMELSPDQPDRSHKVILCAATCHKE